MTVFFCIYKLNELYPFVRFRHTNIFCHFLINPNRDTAERNCIT